MITRKQRATRQRLDDERAKRIAGKRRGLRVTFAPQVPHVGSVAVKAVRGRDPDYLAWIRTQPCVVTGRIGTEDEPVEACHTKTRGAGGDDRTAIPLLWEEHRAQHTEGFATYARRRGLDYDAVISELQARYESWLTAGGRI